MSARWLDILSTIGIQHLWQSAVLLLLATVAFRLRPVSAGARSWIWFCVFVVAVASPLAVFLPGDVPSIATAPVIQVNAIPLAEIGHPASSSVAGGVMPAVMLSTIIPVATLTWFCGFLWSLSRLFAGWKEARQLQRSAHPMPGLERLLSHELPDNVGVRVSDRIAGPMVVGLLRQCILVPRTLVAELPVAALRDILRHEIAHVRRNDMWVSLAQRLFLAIYWWNPFLRLIGMRLSLAREMACDERAALQSGEGRAYANSLLASVDRVLAQRHRRHLLASGIFGTRSELAQRIHELLDMETNARRSGARPALVLCGAVLAVSITLTLVATPRVGYAAVAMAQAGASSQSGNAELLVAAAEAGEMDAVRRLVRSGVRVDARVVGEGTALIAASRAGNLRMVDMLLRMRAPVDQPSLRDGNPLIVASMHGHLDVVERLIRARANVNAVVRHDETPLINAARAGHLPIVRTLVEHGADVNLAVRADFGVRSPLNQASDDAVRSYLAGKGALPGGRL